MTEVATSDQLLVVIDPLARHTDSESVRIAKDVLSAGAASAKVCLPQGPEEFARALERRGSRRPVVVGDDRALLRAVSLLHRQRELDACALSLVPVGDAGVLARSLGVPTGTVAAARAALDGAERWLDLLVDDSDGVVLGAVGIPPVPVAPTVIEPSVMTPSSWLRTCQSFVRTLATRPPRLASPAAPEPSRLRVEVDGATLVDLDQPVEAVSVAPNGGGAAVEVRPVPVGTEAEPLRAVGRRVTVSGPTFRYRADSVVTGPVRTRTWTVREGAWGLTLPG
ncbi:diacylglycerol kinase [Streptomyces bluensis]|uniref:Diacylglycerol kinase n=1 Tax=Streptomyces bluensis TaxID=33897 RepID=A0ABW6UA57_9ACTN